MSIFTDVEQQLNIVGTTSDPGYAWWPQAQILDALNIALLDTYGIVRYQLSTATITLTASQPLTGWPSSQIMIPQYVLYTNAYIYPTTFPLLQDWSANYRNAPVAQPQWMVPWDAQNLYFWPPPDQNYQMVLYGVPWPPLFTSTNTDITGIDQNLYNIILHRACAYLLEETQPQLADNYDREATEHEKRFWRTVRNMQSDNTLRLRPTKGWTGAQLGDIKLGRQWVPSNNSFA